MAAEIAPALRKAVEVLKTDPSLLHKPELVFFKEYLISLGADLPVLEDDGVLLSKKFAKAFGSETKLKWPCLLYL